MGKNTKSFYLVFLMLVLSFSSGIPHFASDLEVQEEPRTVVLSPLDANEAGFQHGSIFFTIHSRHWRESHVRNPR